MTISPPEQIGVFFAPDHQTIQFRVWAPVALKVEVVFDEKNSKPLEPVSNGFWTGSVPVGSKMIRYKFRLDGGETFPDPASRFQPEGPHGWSQVVDSRNFRWTDHAWTGAAIRGQSLYEMHIGTFTPEGTWQAAATHLPYLRDTGLTLIEIMPVADFPGKFGWGYDGVQPFAPVALYGTPDDMRAFVDRAHSLGLGVILDVVYNHLGPDGNYLTKYSHHYFSDKYKTDWGPAINFDGPESQPVRDYFRANAAYWISEFHLDGLRFDATQDIHDDSPVHILRELGEAARNAAGSRSILLIGENEPQNTRLLRPAEQDGYGFDALWNDDFHHSAMVALTGKSDAYYTDYQGSAQELLSAAKYGYLFQGQWYRWQGKRRGTSTLGLPKHAFVNFIQNHDQVANSARGQRLTELAGPGPIKALTTLTLLLPGTPMLFQGQEFAASSRFSFFADHKPDLAAKIHEGRTQFLSQWRSLVLPEMKKCFEDPADARTFENSRLNHAEVAAHAEWYALHRDLLHLRHEDFILSAQAEWGLDGAVLSPACFVLRYFSSDFRNDRLLLINLGKDLDFNPAPEPLLAPPAAKLWAKLWSSDDPQYGGCGTAVLDSEENWKIPGFAAVVLYPIAASATRLRPQPKTE